MLVMLTVTFQLSWVFYRTLCRFIANMMMGERDERASTSVPSGPLALPGPQSAAPEIRAPIVPNVELETAEPMIAFGVAITKEEREEGQT